MSLTVLSAVSSLTFAERLAGRLGVAVDPVQRAAFPDGERCLRPDLADRFDLPGRPSGWSATPTCCGRRRR